MDRNVDRKKPTSHETDFDKQHMPDSKTESCSTRRTIVKKMAVGSAALACCSVLPSKWTTPILEFGSLPAHATTSTTAEEASPFNKTEKIKRSGDIMIDRILRRKFVSEHVGTYYGESMKIVFNTGGVINVADTSRDVNVDQRGYRPGGGIDPLHDAKEIPTMEVYAEPGSTATYITIHYKG